MAARHNWEVVKKEYVEGIKKDGQLIYPSQRELGEKYNIAPSLIGRKAKTDQWSVQREIFVSKISAKREQKKIDAISDEGSKFDLDCFNVAKTGIKKVVDILSNGVDEEAVSKLSTALKNFQAVGKASLGDKANTVDTLTIEVEINHAED